MSWKEIEFKDFVTLQRGFDLTAANMKDGEVPVMGSSGVVGFHNEFKVNGPGVVTGRSGTLGFVQYTDQDYWPHNTSLWVKDFKGNNPRFVFYMLKILRLERFNGGASVPTLNRNVLDHLKLRVPSTSKMQEEISNALLKYDALVKINEKKIELLEKSARLIYKEWFVHLRFPGHEKVKVVNGVPDGWKNQSLSEFIDVTHGYAFKGEFFVDEITKFVLTTPGNIKVGAGFKSDKFKYYSSDGPVDERYVFQARDIFVGMTDLSKTSDTLGYPAFVPYSEDEVYLHNQRLGRVISKTDYFPRYFIFQILTDFRYRHHVVGAATGTSVKHTSPTRILSYNQYLPPMSKTSLIGKFDELAEPIYLQILNLELQNKKLTSARDLLLPRLMNGDIEL